jgi:pyridoxamine 5'-phosphate oxidase
METANDPLALFSEWFGEAARTEATDPNAMALATAEPDGMPDVRTVLLKSWDHAGFVFYTNTASAKGHQLARNPRAALCFHWKSLARQVRIRGKVGRVTDAEADAYFASRPRGSQLGAWVSKQSRPLPSREVLEQELASFTTDHLTRDIPRPPDWSGFRVIPERMEFWVERPFRLHDRVRFTAAAGGGWTRVRLYP